MGTFKHKVTPWKHDFPYYWMDITKYTIVCVVQNMKFNADAETKGMSIFRHELWKLSVHAQQSILSLLVCHIYHFLLWKCVFLLHLSLSVNSQMTCVWPNCHSAVHKFLPLFYWKWLNGNLARHFKIKNINIFKCEWLNGNLNDLCMAEWQFRHSHSNSNTNGNWEL